jgi:RNA polymerase sigma-70 factor (ECF subfamily)
MTKLYLPLNALTYAVFAAWSTLAPRRTGQYVGLRASSAAGESEYLAGYGGPQAGLALFSGLALVSAEHRRFALWMSALLYGGLAVFRTIAVAHLGLGQLGNARLFHCAEILLFPRRRVPARAPSSPNVCMNLSTAGAESGVASALPLPHWITAGRGARSRCAARVVSLRESAPAMPQPRDPSEHILQRIARGDAGAVEDCVQRYAPLVWSLAKRLTHDASTVEELVQEVFVDVWRSAGRFDPEISSEATFIATIVRRRIIDRQRRAARSPTVELPEDSVLAAEPEPGPAAVDARDEARLAVLALQQIKPEQRRLILMAVIEGLTHQEIASSTGLPLGTVKSHIRRGLDRTAQILRSSRKEVSP